MKRLKQDCRIYFTSWATYSPKLKKFNFTFNLCDILKWYFKSISFFVHDKKNSNGKRTQSILYERVKASATLAVYRTATIVWQAETITKLFYLHPVLVEVCLSQVSFINLFQYLVLLCMCRLWFVIKDIT